MSLDIFKSLDKLNQDASTLADSSLSVVSGWIDTGCMALNVICSGSLYGGVPKGRIIGFAGPSQAGKSYIMNKIIGKFQKESPDHWAVIWDTEAAVEPGMVKNVGADPKRIRVMPVGTVEECRNQIVTFLNKVIEKGPEAYGKYIIVIDSLGNLASQKELNDAEAGKDAVDMGLRAKQLKSMMRSITYKAAKAGVTVLFSNHTYDDPASMFPSLVKSQAGGKGPLYMASLLVQLSATQEKEDSKSDNAINPIANRVSGANISAMTVKNRFIPAFLKTTVYLNFKTGLDKYEGLLDMAKGYGVIEQAGATYSLADGTKLGYYKSWKDKHDVWDKILPELEKVLQKEIHYKSEEEQTQELEPEEIDD